MTDLKAANLEPAICDLVRASELTALAEENLRETRTDEATSYQDAVEVLLFALGQFQTQTKKLKQTYFGLVDGDTKD
jgi:hypothetical protein